MSHIKFFTLSILLLALAGCANTNQWTSVAREDQPTVKVQTSQPIQMAVIAPRSGATCIHVDSRFLLNPPPVAFIKESLPFLLKDKGYSTKFSCVSPDVSVYIWDAGAAYENEIEDFLAAKPGTSMNLGTRTDVSVNVGPGMPGIGGLVGFLGHQTNLAYSASQGAVWAVFVEVSTSSGSRFRAVFSTPYNNNQWREDLWGGGVERMVTSLYSSQTAQK